MEITLAGGAVVDIGTKADIERSHDSLASLLKQRKIHGQRVTGSVASGTAPLVMDLDHPPRGMIWFPQYIVITGDDVFGGAISNVTAAVFAGRLPRRQELTIGPPVGNLDLAGCILTGGAGGLSVPNWTPFQATVPIYGMENLYVILTGTGTAAGATKYTATCGVLELQADDSDQRSWLGA